MFAYQVGGPEFFAVLGFIAICLWLVVRGTSSKQTPLKAYGVNTPPPLNQLRPPIPPAPPASGDPLDPRLLVERLQTYVGSSRVAKDMDSKPVVAVLAGPAVVIEVVVQKAMKETGIRMDWGYIGGRAIVHADVQTEKEHNKAGEALQYNIPTCSLIIPTAHSTANSNA